MVFDLVTGQRGRLVPNSIRASKVYGAEDLQITPSGLLGFFRRTWLKGIPTDGGRTDIIIPPDNTLPGVEKQYIFIMNYASADKMETSIVNKLSVFVKDNVDKLRANKRELEISEEHLTARLRAKSRGVQSDLKDLTAVRHIMDKTGQDSSKMKHRQRMFPGESDDE